MERRRSVSAGARVFLGENLSTDLVHHFVCFSLEFFESPFWAKVSGVSVAALVCSGNHGRRERKQEHCFKAIIIVLCSRPTFFKL